MFIDAWIGLATAIAGVTVTEEAQPAYARAPVSFALVPPRWTGEASVRAFLPRATNSTAFAFGVRDTIAGRLIYDAPTGGNLLLILPFGSGPRGYYPNVLTNAGEITVEGPMLDPGFAGTLTAGAALGSCWDPLDITGQRSADPDEVAGPTGIVVQAAKSNALAAVNLVLMRGTLLTASAFASL